MKLKNNSNVNQNTFALSPAGTSKRNVSNKPLTAGVAYIKEHEVNHLRINDASDVKYLFNFGEKLGKGSFGVVLKVQEKSTEKVWAMKILNRNKIGPERLRSLEHEIQILKVISHPHVINLDRLFESPTTIYLVLELCREELTEMFKRKHNFNEDETRYIISQLVSAVSYLHKNYIIHRDIKLENILIAPNPLSVNDELYIKLSDFGLSTVLTGIGIEDMLHDCCGTLTYMAPEMLSKNYNQQCDVWSMGILMYLLLNGEFPFYSRDEVELIKMIRTNEPTYVGLNLGTDGLQVLKKMLRKNPTMRITSAEIENHSWILNRPSNTPESQNVIDMMRQWKNELKMPNIGDECDWIAASTVPKDVGLSSQESELSFEHKSSELNLNLINVTTTSDFLPAISGAAHAGNIVLIKETTSVLPKDFSQINRTPFDPQDKRPMVRRSSRDLSPHEGFPENIAALNVDIPPQTPAMIVEARSTKSRASSKKRIKQKLQRHRLSTMDPKPADPKK